MGTAVTGVMWKLPKRVPPSLRGRLVARSYAGEGQKPSPATTKPSEPLGSTPPPPPPPPTSGGGGGVFLKLLGLTTVVGGGTLGYAWYDSGFRKSIEDNIPYSKNALESVFKYLPDSPSKAEPQGTPKKRYCSGPHCEGSRKYQEARSC